MGGQHFSSSSQKRVFNKRNNQKNRLDCLDYFTELRLSSLDDAAKDICSGLPQLIKCQKAKGDYTRKENCEEIQKSGRKHPFLLQHCVGCPYLKEDISTK